MNLINKDVLKALKELQDNSIDCIITSPPYNFKQNGGDIKIKYNKYDDNKSNEEYENWQIEIMDELWRVLKPEGHLFYNHKDRYEKGILITPMEWIVKTKLKLFQRIIWNTKRKIDNSGSKFTPQTEDIYWLKKENHITKLEKGFINGNLWELGKSESYNKHPAPFPLILPLRILLSLYKENTNKIILDPFMGSGTVGIACYFTGHKFIGIEYDEEYIKMFNNRNREREREKYNMEKLNHIVKKPYNKDKRKIK